MSFVVIAVLAGASVLAPAASAQVTDPAPEQDDGGVAPPTRPDAPLAVVAEEQDRSLEIDWSPPAFDGGSPVTGYEVVAVPDDRDVEEPPAVAVDATATSAVLSPLVNGVSYDLTVTAVNTVGPGMPAEASGTPRTVPRAPAIRSVDAGDGSAVVRWVPPVDDGGAPIRHYAITTAPGGAVTQVGGSRTSATVSGLPNGAPAKFTVWALNIAGTGPASSSSAAVTPRRIAGFTVVTQPARRVVYGRDSVVTARLATAAGVGVPSQQVHLLAKTASSNRWRPVAAGTTGTQGRVRLRATLPASASLRLRHPVGAVSAPDQAVRAVTVEKRITASTAHSSTRVGRRVLIRGRVAPDQRTGSPVRLQRRVDGSWQTIASGRMTTQRRYEIRWTPRAVGGYALRVLKPGDAARAAGVSPRWTHRVDPETAADVAGDILRNGRITLATVHVWGTDSATARQNVVDIANGRPARRSCRGGAPCGSTSVDIRVLRAIRDMGTRGTVTISEIAGGVHAGRSSHYSGRAVDITWVNGRHVARGVSYGMVTDACRANGSNVLYTPSSDPWGGHSRHVHCGW